MHDRLLNLKNQAIAQISQSQTLEELNSIRLQYLGRRGSLAEIAKQIKTLPVEEKVRIGQLFNDVKSAIELALQSGKTGSSKPKTPSHDLSLPGTPIPVGLLHPISSVAREMNSIFQQLGFSIANGPEIETDEYNYDRLNLPPDHPARDLQDSIYIREPDILLRTHTSSVEAHLLADHTPPYRFVFPGKAYRYENVSASNHMMFFQYQGLAVGEGITMANLRWTLDTFITEFFGSKRRSRFRCKYYPEVEPGVGVDIDCPFCQSKGCPVCKYRGWIEILGAGMVHPALLSRVGLNPDRYSGFAWGMGLDRLAMARYEINDIRALFNGSLVYDL